MPFTEGQSGNIASTISLGLRESVEKLRHLQLHSGGTRSGTRAGTRAVGAALATTLEESGDPGSSTNNESQKGGTQVLSSVMEIAA